MKKKENILGVTGSVGSSAISIIANNTDKYELSVISSNQNWKDLAKIARELNAKVAIIVNSEYYQNLKDELTGTDVIALCGSDALKHYVMMDNDITIAAIVGISCLQYVWCAIEGCKRLAIANKESLVCAGEFILQKAKQYGVQIIPVDSEHSAIFQLLEEKNLDKVEKIVITASGGALRDYDLNQLSSVRPEDALRHPNWSMGAKITIDSATLANKGLEFIEAKVLFKDLDVDVLMHRQSVIHGIVYYKDGSVLSHMGSADMRVPVAYALSYPERLDILDKKHFDLSDVWQLTFEKPDYKRFPMLKIAIDTVALGLGARTLFNVANEVMVSRFLRGEIGFLDIQNNTSNVMNALNPPILSSVDDVERYYFELLNIL